MFGSSNLVVKALVKAMICMAFVSIFATKSFGQTGSLPSFSVQPSGIAVQNGGIGVLTATVKSSTKVNISWYFNGTKVDNALVVTVPVILVGNVTTLTIPSVNAGSSGTYTVYATNAAGTSVSSNAVVVTLGSVVSNIVSTVTNTVNFVSSAVKLTTSGFQLQLSVPIGSNIVIHASSDLSHWTPISTNSSSTGTLTFTDTNALHVTSRFYRAVIQ
jgi:hypothetical protein